MKMIRYILVILALLSGLNAIAGPEQRTEVLLKEWKFRQGHDVTAEDGWQKVTVPHDWAVYGPFSRNNDLQEVAVVQNGEKNATVKTGRTGGLPYVGKGCYRRTVNVGPKDGRRYVLLFDGAMSEARVFVNGKKVCFWPYGYNAFSCDITDAVNEGDNDVYVLLENRPQSSRWYPGAGLYRKVRMLTLPNVHVPVWGTYITTPYVGKDYADVSLKVRVEGLAEGETVTLRTKILNSDGMVVAQRSDTRKIFSGRPVEQNIIVDEPELWSPENPVLYRAVTEVMSGGGIVTEWNGRNRIAVADGTVPEDVVTTRFGIRSIEIRPDKGFFLNGQKRKFRGVCLHHDLGPLGAAVSEAAIRRQLTMLKDMGCDAVRTAHNMPAPELVELCDEMGLMVMVEPFDEWDMAKCENGYHRFFNEDSGNGVTWAERDMVNMLHHFRNNASVVMWSTGNEVPSQWAEGGREVAAWLQDICHREDPTRPVTCGMDQFDAVLGNGFASMLDVAGFNYKVGRYTEAYRLLPQNIILGSETASTVSSRGTYHFPVKVGADILHPDHHSSSYDVEFCSWSNIPDDDFAADEDRDWVIGQFVWTGFDYLGEPSPYDTDAWPNHSSMFGIIDLASIPKDRYYLYRSIWNKTDETLHVLPHWNWAGREGETTPVYVYTSYSEAELFVNGISQGRRSKSMDGFGASSHGRAGTGADAVMKRFRLMWNDVVYQPGELKVIAYDGEGNAVEEKTVCTAGKAYSVKLEADRTVLKADGEDLAYVNVSLVDKNGNPVPADSREIKVKVKGNGKFRAMANGDPTCLEPFHEPQMHLFNGQLTVIVQSGTAAGDIVLEVTAPCVRKAFINLKAE